MTRQLANFKVEQRTKDGYFNLTGLLNSWNSETGAKKELKDYFDNKATQEFVKALADEENLHGEKCPYVKSKARADRGGGTWGHPLLFIDFAMWLNPAFKVKVLKFVSDQMLSYRNEAGEAYKMLASAVSKIAPKNSIREYMETIAKGLNWIIVGRHDKMVRNEYGTEEKQKEYFLLEKQVAMLINDGFLKTGDEVVNYLRTKFQKKFF